MAPHGKSTSTVDGTLSPAAPQGKGDLERTPVGDLGNECTCQTHKELKMLPTEERRAPSGSRRPSAESDGAAFDEGVLDFVRHKMEPDVVAFFRLLLKEGRKQPGDSGVSMDSKPSWVDDEKIRLGQQFAQEYLFGVMLAEMTSLFLLFAFPGTIKPFIFSGNSDTPLKAFRRYLSTTICVRSWFSGDLWTEGGEARRHLQYVRRVHDKYRHRLNALNSAPEEERCRFQLQVAPWTEGAAAAVRQDFAAEGAAAGEAICPFFNLLSTRDEWVNQMEMSFTQCSFVGLAVTYPDLFGTSSASEAELDAFVHLWEVIGHLLGVEHRFNFCAGGLHTVRKRCMTAVRAFALPSMAQVDDTWEHMTRCAVSGVRFYSPHLSFEVVLAHACGIFGSEAPKHLLQQLTVLQRLQLRLLAWVLRWAMRVTPLRAFLNWRLRWRLARAQKHADDPEWLRERDGSVGYASFQRRREDDTKDIASRSVFGVHLLLTVVTAVATAAMAPQQDLFRTPFSPSSIIDKCNFWPFI